MEHGSIDDIMVIIYHPGGKRFALCGPDEIALLEKLLEGARQRKTEKSKATEHTEATEKKIVNQKS